MHDNELVEQPALKSGETAAEASEEKSFFDLLYGIITKPVQTMRYIADKKLIFVGIVLTISIAWINSIANIPGMLSSFSQTTSGLETLPAVGVMRGFILALAVILPPFSATFILLMQAGIFHILAVLFKGKGSYDGLIGVLGFASFPSIIAIPFALLDLLATRSGWAGYTAVMVPVTLVVSLGLVVWILVLDVIGVRENYQLSTWRAFLVVTIPIIVFIVLAAAFFIAIAVFAVGALSSLGLH